MYYTRGNDHLIRIGEELVQQGSVGAIILAGGQGTRLGLNGPKGVFPTTPIKKKSLFQVFTERVLACSNKFSKKLPLAVMTSPDNDRQTREFFSTHNNFSLPNDDLSFFTQSTLPLLDKDKQVIKINNSPLFVADGNGSFYWSFAQQGILAKWKDRGIKYITVFIVDNPLLEPFDLECIGLGASHENDLVLIVTNRLSPEEKVGVVIKKDSTFAVVEYTDIEKESPLQKLPLVANTSYFCMSIDFVERVAALDKTQFPIHYSQKKQKGFSEPCIKQEYFIFDMLSESKKTELLFYPREERFAPLKNISGEDSPDTCQKALMANDRAVFEKISGLRLDPTIPIELSQQFHYPTDSLIKAWKNKPLPREGYVE